MRGIYYTLARRSSALAGTRAVAGLDWQALGARGGGILDLQLSCCACSSTCCWCIRCNHCCCFWFDGLPLGGVGYHKLSHHRDGSCYTRLPPSVHYPPPPTHPLIPSGCWFHPVPHSVGRQGGSTGTQASYQVNRDNSPSCLALNNACQHAYQLLAVQYACVLA